MRVLVTGGAGYVGSVLVGSLLEQRHDVTVMDNLRKGGLGLLPHFANMFREPSGYVPRDHRLIIVTAFTQGVIRRTKTVNFLRVGVAD